MSRKVKGVIRNFFSFFGVKIYSSRTKDLVIEVQTKTQDNITMLREVRTALKKVL